MKPSFGVSGRHFLFSRNVSSGSQSRSISDNSFAGKKYILNPHVNKGTAFDMKERMQLGIHGLIPPRVTNLTLQRERIIMGFDVLQTDIQKYTYLMDILDRNESLFYSVVQSDISKYMPIIYTPTVGQACIEYGTMFKRPRGLYITLYDRGNIASVIDNWPEKDVQAVVVTDGERILGLGDLGVQGMGIPVGKLALYTACAGIKPSTTLPVQIDVGTDNESLLNDKFYLGLRQRRVRGLEYEELIDEFMVAVTHKYGKHCLIQFEDFGNHNAFAFLRKYKSRYTTFNDDIQGTAACATAGLIASAKITGRPVSENKFLFLGAGEAGLGVATLLVRLLRDQGVHPIDAYKKIWLFDVDGLITSARGDVEPMQQKFAHDHPEVKTFEEAVDILKPTGIIGLAGAGRLFTKSIIDKMGKNHERPIIFALSNPTSRAECTAEEAYFGTQGRCVFASGSPFEPVEYKGKKFEVGQGNNVYVFPGVALAAILTGATSLNDTVFLIAAKTVANELTDEEAQLGRVYPSLNRIKDISIKVALEVTKYLFDAELATYRPEPHDHLKWIKSKVWDPEYQDVLRPCYPDKFNETCQNPIPCSNQDEK